MLNLTNTLKLITVTAICIASVGCTSVSDQAIIKANPDQRLNQMMALYQNVEDMGDGCHEIWRAQGASVDCQRIMNEIEKLYIEFPAHKRIILSNAIVNIDLGRPENAQSLLDQLSLFQRAFPEAAILRAEIAIHEGNLNFADSLIERQILLTPDNAALREVAASIAYLQNNFDQARQALSIAGRLGSPAWRLSYHHGLLSEAQLDLAEACEFYIMSLNQKQDFQSALSRLIGLLDQPGCEEGMRFIR